MREAKIKTPKSLSGTLRNIRKSPHHKKSGCNKLFNEAFIHKINQLLKTVKDEFSANILLSSLSIPDAIT